MKTRIKTLFFAGAIGSVFAIAPLESVVALSPKNMAEPPQYNCLTREVFTPEKQAWCDRWQVLQDANYIVPITLDAAPTYTTVTLENGSYQQADGQLIVELVNERGINFGDLNGDGKTDAAALFGVALDPDGRSVGTYLTAVLDVDGAAQALTPIRVGERVALNHPIAIEERRIVLPLLTMTEVVNRAYEVEGDRLVALAHTTAAESVLASIPNGTLAFAQTSSYAMRVLTQNGVPRLNLFNRETQRSELSAASVIVESSVAGITYGHLSTPPVRITVSSAGVQQFEVNGEPLEDYAQITGRVTYRSRIALPPNAVIEVALADVSRADAAAEVLASQAIVLGDRQVPVDFQLVYDPEQIDLRFSYAVQARISVDGQLRFINTRRIPVITQGNPTEVEVVVDPVSR